MLSFVMSFFICLATLSAVDFHKFDAYQNKLAYEDVRQKIIKYLEKSTDLKNFYKLTAQALYIGDIDQKQIDYVLYLRKNGPNPLRKNSKRNGLKGARIALDPGHFGGAFAELEERCVKVAAAHTKNNQDIYLAEGDLTYLTALELKNLLEAEGALVFISREGRGKGAIKEDFFEWKKRHPDLSDDNLSKIFRTYYNREDLRKRAEKINDFSPDITLIIHYNTHQVQAGTFLTKSNYNLAFIPGAFGPEELKKQEDRYEFLRLLLTDAVEESLELSRCIVQEFYCHLNVPLITAKDTTSYIEKVCLFQEPGIYCRNLALTRLIHSPLCYGESLVQNNEEEVYRLALQDSYIGQIPCSSRIQQVAKAYFEGIKRYFNTNVQ